MRKLGFVLPANQCFAFFIFFSYCEGARVGEFLFALRLPLPLTLGRRSLSERVTSRCRESSRGTPHWLRWTLASAGTGSLLVKPGPVYRRFRRAGRDEFGSRHEAGWVVVSLPWIGEHLPPYRKCNITSRRNSGHVPLTCSKCVGQEGRMEQNVHFVTCLAPSQNPGKPQTMKLPTCLKSVSKTGSLREWIRDSFTPPPSRAGFHEALEHLRPA
jgi:hypothetical protein